LEPQAERRRRQLYGRRKGPKLSQHQSSLFETLLPQLELKLAHDSDPRTYFDDVDDVWLEIGFGGGEHLLWQAQHHPNIGLMGAEPYETGVAKLLSKLSSPACGGGVLRSEATQEGGGARNPLPPSASLRSAPPPHAGEEHIRNIRIYQSDAREIVEALPDASLGRVFILFPDPWPKTRHHKRRFIQMDMLDALSRVMKPGAELRFASDDSGYLSWTLERLLAHPAFRWTATCADDWNIRPADWPPTRYEEKALHGVPVFLKFVRV
jgi:tRNA (guanine-N7-)-methyltransferase